jgi:transposase
MRQVHRAGEKCFVDYAGQKPRLIDPATGEVRAVELFVAVLGASNYTYAEATRTQQVPDWIASHQRAFAASRVRVATSRACSAPNPLGGSGGGAIGPERKSR